MAPNSCWPTPGILSSVQAKALKWPEYRRLLNECQALYGSTRLQLMAPVVEARINAAAQGTLPQLCRNGSAYLLQVWQVVWSLVGGSIACDAMLERRALIVSQHMVVSFAVARDGILIDQRDYVFIQMEGLAASYPVV